jgi:HEAT repeat protein
MSLFKEGDDPRARLDAVEKLTDEDALVEVACTDDSPRVRLVAVSKINDDSRLLKVIENAKELDVRLVAVERLSSQQLVADIVKKRENIELIGVCFSRITDAKLITSIAHDQECNPVARRMAVEHFADESYLAEATKAAETVEKKQLDRKSPEAVSAFMDAYGGGLAGVRAIGRFRRSEKALKALGTIAGKGGEEGGLAIEYLCQGLASPNPSLKKCAADELAELKDPETVASLIRSLDNPNLREPIREVLKRIDTPEARAALGPNGETQ